ncbi:hypothetical protein D3C72_661990 [compost metagenome]
MTQLTHLTDRFTSHLDWLVAALCLVPAVGFVLAWHMQVDFATFARFAILPALLALVACETWMARKAPAMLKRLAVGLMGGLVATAAFDLVRLPASLLFKGAPDYVPLVGQHLLGETIGIAPTAKAVMIGYGFHYLLMGALLGGAYALLAGRVHAAWGLGAGLLLGVAFAALPQFQLLSVGSGFSVEVAMAVVVAAFGAAGAILGTVVDGLGRANPTVTPIGFWRETPIEAK